MGEVQKQKQQKTVNVLNELNNERYKWTLLQIVSFVNKFEIFVIRSDLVSLKKILINLNQSQN